MIAGLYDIFAHWHKEGTCWLVSDTHFGDEELAAAGLNPLRSDPDAYVRLINSKCGKNDCLVHLGDVGDIEQIRKLKARHKVLIMGNHDSGASKYKRRRFQEICDADKYTRAECIAAMKEKYPGHDIYVSEWTQSQFHSPFEYYIAFIDNKLFDEVYTGPVIIGEKLMLSHEPIHGLDYMMNIHGHVHDPKAKDNAHHLNICPDATGNFEPVNFNRLMKSGFMSKIGTLHRSTIDNATARARKRGKKNGK